MSFLRQREIVVLLTFATGAYMLFDYYIKIGASELIGQEITNWVVILSGFAMTLGVINSLFLHGRRIQRRESRWWMSAYLIVLFVVMIISGLIPPLGTHTIFNWLYTNVQVPLESTTYSLLALWVASAGYRAFRARNWEATALLTFGFLVMLGNTPMLSSFWPGFEEIRAWIYNVPNTGGVRAITITGGVGAVILAIRTFLGREKGYLAEAA